MVYTAHWNEGGGGFLSERVCWTFTNDLVGWICALAASCGAFNDWRRVCIFLYLSWRTSSSRSPNDFPCCPPSLVPVVCDTVAVAADELHRCKAVVSGGLAARAPSGQELDSFWFVRGQKARLEIWSLRSEGLMRNMHCCFTTGTFSGSRVKWQIVCFSDDPLTLNHSLFYNLQSGVFGFFLCPCLAGQDVDVEEHFVLGFCWCRGTSV